MKELKLQLTDKQAELLKKFAVKHYHNARDNKFTAYPIHFVQTKQYEYIPYSSDIEEYFIGVQIVFSTDDEFQRWHESEIEAVSDWYEFQEEECPIEIKSYQELYWKDIAGVDGAIRCIISYEDYFKTYGVRVTAIAWRKHYWRNVAPFFILDEAKRYLEYQKLNLIEPRIFTYSSGYANYGDYEHFWDLLMTIGQQLNKGNSSDYIIEDCY